MALTIDGAALVYWRTESGPWHRSLELANGTRLTAEGCNRDAAAAVAECNSLEFADEVEDPVARCRRCNLDPDA